MVVIWVMMMITYHILQQPYWQIFQPWATRSNSWDILYLKFLEDIIFFCGATDTLILDFWWYLPCVSILGWIPSLVCFITYMQQIPQIYLCCDTCWSLGGYHGSWVISSMYLQISIGRAQVQDQACCCLTACDKTDALLTELHQLRYSLCNYFIWKD